MVLERLRNIVVNAVGGGGGIDISDSTVTADTLSEGVIGYTADGERIDSITKQEV